MNTLVDEIVSDLIVRAAPVCFGVSGGKDSTAAAISTMRYLDQVGHKGPRLLIHSHLGRVEWQESLPMCERLATHLGLELVVVQRQAGDMMDRWLTRWSRNVDRYVNLSCVKLILPWSTPSMRFCTSELKSAVICRELVHRFPGQTILSVAGIRREESSQRAKAPISKPQPRLSSVSHRTAGFDWHPILDWSLSDVLGFHKDVDFPLHEAYGTYGTSRVSCVFCILGSRNDLAAATGCYDNHAIYCEMVQLEAASTFSFQDAGWLGDVAPHLLDQSTRDALLCAKAAAKRREAAEGRIPKHLLYTKGWPTVMPTQSEAELLADVRLEVASAVGLALKFTKPSEIIGRYQELMDASAGRAA
jgi:3'-phosphoadenosine 5'-phosphosulfate sulfotransferase (PAPS reductase)/FAD synthetase